MGGSGIQPRPMIERVLKMWWGKVQQVGLGSDNKYPGGALFTFGNVCTKAFLLVKKGFFDFHSNPG